MFKQGADGRGHFRQVGKYRHSPFHTDDIDVRANGLIQVQGPVMAAHVAAVEIEGLPIA